LPDSDADGVPDVCDICPDGDDTLDTDGDGMPDDCDICNNNLPETCTPAPPILAPPPHDILKNRYISIDPRGEAGINNGLPPYFIRVELVSTLVSGVDPVQIGSRWWANVPDANCISIVGPTQPATPRNWDVCPTLHLMGCAIIPTSSYEIAAVIDGLQSAPPLAAETQLRPADDKWWADAVGHFTGSEGTPPNVWTGPQGVTNFEDVTACLKTFLDPNAINATHVSVMDIHPNRPDLGGLSVHPNKLVGGDDIFQFIQGFKGREYPGGDLAGCTDP